MRKKAEKLEKGNWYADREIGNPILLKFRSNSKRRLNFSKQTPNGNYTKTRRTILFSYNSIFFIATEKDLQKYNLKQTDK